ncbi:MAG: Crp/Fnr family transcriptional regulator [Lachnospiraceae bacterium]|nr:Crp/Fnr family transcriptional regulator [Lachnospiraceae bacterium]
MEITAFWRDIIGLKGTELLAEAVSYSEICRLKKRSTVIRENECLTEIPFLVSGVVKSYCLGGDGSERIFCFGYRAGEPVTSIYSLDKEITSLCTIEVVSDAELLYIPLKELNRLVLSSIEAARIYEAMLSVSLYNTVERNRALVSYTARQRYEWFTEFYPGLEELISKKDIASFLNMSSESLSRVRKIIKN